jgi:6-phosphogluconate dehydrogenase
MQHTDAMTTDPNPEQHELGIVGLGRMGANVALQARDKGFRVVGFDPKGVSDELLAAGVVAAP